MIDNDLRRVGVGGESIPIPRVIPVTVMNDELRRIWSHVTIPVFVAAAVMVTIIMVVLVLFGS